jgi:predicted ester cyclase
MPTTLTPAQMKAHVRSHFEDFVNNQKPEVIRINMTEDFFDHDGPGGKPTGVEGDEEMMRAMYAIFPDLHIAIDEMIAEGDRVVCRNRWQGTNARTGKRMEFHGFVEWRFEGDKIAERWATVTPPAEIAE